MVVGIVTARAGSKGLPGKNLRKLGGQPLIWHTLEVAKRASKLDMVFLTTDIQEAIDLANDMGGIYAPFKRPAEFSTDTASQVDVVLHVLDFLNKEGNPADSFVILQPTAPFRTPEEIDQGVELLESADSVIGVCEAIHHPADYLFENDAGNLEFLLSDFKGMRRQDFPPIYFNNGAFYACKTDYFKKNLSFYDEYSKILKMNSRTIVDIDSELDLELAETLIKQK